MLISELPEECLLIIFGFINELDDLVNCYKICSQWSRLILERTRKVKYLFEHSGPWNKNVPPSYPSDYVYYSIDGPMDVTFLSTLFPDLQIVDFSSGFCEESNPEDIVTWVKKMKSLKGLKHYSYPSEEAIFQYCGQLEMVSTDFIETCTNKNSVNIKQLCLVHDTFGSFRPNAHYFPNLERLSLNTEEGPRSYYDGPIFERLKMVEFFTMDCTWLKHYDDPHFYGFQFMDSCPNLQSAHIFLDYNRFFVDETLKHESLQDLVIEFYEQYYTDSINWDEFKRLFMKYPNLKHLALRSWNRLTNEHVEQLVTILPNLVLFDVSGCPKVTRKAAVNIQNYNRLYKRTIKFYFDGNHRKIKSDWPHLSSRREIISQGFDFMKHCFLKDFYDLPTFLIPSED
ncbi:uncharacterized protein LOC112539499 [Tetranychus urticae]|uniref:F-box domain-containing protein n=1 Tax=Tetranychus urticae TaxID=32264 RepID=T1JRS8_TETUR|nr:uncharacterized protein LOC112539499 [Tetranychus urticae]